MAELVVRNMEPGATYGVQVQARNGEGVSPWSGLYTFDIRKDQTPPAAVTNLSWNPQGTSFVGTWDANSDADFSHFYIRVWYGDGLGQKQKFFKSVSPSFSLTYEENKYHFGSAQGTLNLWVTSVDTSNNPNPSWAQATAVNAKPAPVTGFAAASGLDSIMLSWDKHPEDDVIGYKIEFVTANTNVKPTSGWLASANVTSNSFVFPTNMYSKYYWFRIFAYDIFNGDSDPAFNTPANGILAQSAFSVDTEAPAQPATRTAAAATGANAPGIVVTWTASTSTDVYGYRIRYKDVNTSTWNYIGVASTDTSHTIRNLTPGVSYDVAMTTFDKNSNELPYVTVGGSPVAVTGKTTAPSAWTPVIKSFDNFQTLSVYLDNEHPDADVKWGAGTYDIQIDATAESTATAPTFSSTNAQTQRVGAPAAVFNIIRSWDETTTPVTRAKYWIRIRAVNSSGVAGAWSTPVTNVVNRTDDDIPTGSLPAESLRANSAFVHKLFIKNDTANGANRVGAIQTTDFDTGDGFKLDATGLYINNGIVKAAAVHVQNGPNIMPPEYSQFDWRSDFYRNVAATERPKTLDTSNTTNAKSTAWGVHGDTSLRITNSPNVTGYTFFSPDSSTYNIPMSQGLSWIGSAWLYNPGTSAVSGSLRFRQNTDGAYSMNESFTLSAGQARRVEAAFTPNASATALNCSVWITTSSGVVHVTAIQLEEKMGGRSTASSYTKPGITTIDGGTVTTGVIRSASNLSIAGVTQPYWSLSATGDAILGSAYVRGQLVVGVPAPTAGATVATDGGPLTTAGVSIRSHNWSGPASTTGWGIRSEGDVYFNSGTFRGTIYADGGEFKGNITGATGTFGGGLNIGNGAFVVSTAGALDIGADFSVTAAGKMSATGITVSGTSSLNGTVTVPAGSNLSVGGQISGAGLITGPTIRGSLFQTGASGTWRAEVGGSFDGMVIKDSSNVVRAGIYYDGTDFIIGKETVGLAIKMRASYMNFGTYEGGVTLDASGGDRSIGLLGDPTVSGNLILDSGSRQIWWGIGGTLRLGYENNDGPTLTLLNNQNTAQSANLNARKLYYFGGSWGSSREYKRDIVDQPESIPGLKEAKAMNLKRYKMRPERLSNPHSKKELEREYVGLIAEEVPDYLRTESEDGSFVGIDSIALTYTMLASIQELSAEVESLKAQLKKK